MGLLRIVIETPEPVRLRDYLRRRTGVSARLLTQLKQSPEGILCNGVPWRTVDLVRAGDVVVLTMPEGRGLEPNPALRVPAVLETAHYIVYDKPTSMPVHPSAKHRRDTLGNYFAACMPSHTFRAVNRLDRDTSGLCMIAKDAYTAGALQGKLDKRYYAVLCGRLTRDGTISAPIARAEASIITRCVREDGQPAVTHYRVLGCSPDYTAVEIRLETGRTHQIRVHFAHLGYPLAGDDLYGGSCRDIDRQALHCGRLFWRDPVTGQPCSAVSPWRREMQQLVPQVQLDWRNLNEEDCEF